MSYLVIGRARVLHVMHVTVSNLYWDVLGHTHSCRLFNFTEFNGNMQGSMPITTAIVVSVVVVLTVILVVVIIIILVLKKYRGSSNSSTGIVLEEVDSKVHIFIFICQTSDSY